MSGPGRKNPGDLGTQEPLQRVWGVGKDLSLGREGLKDKERFEGKAHEGRRSSGLLLVQNKGSRVWSPSLRFLERPRYLGTADYPDPIHGPPWFCTLSQRSGWKRGYPKLASPVPALTPLNSERAGRQSLQSTLSFPKLAG